MARAPIVPCRAGQQGPSLPSARSHRTMRSGKTLLFYPENENRTGDICASRSKRELYVSVTGDRSLRKILVFQNLKAPLENLKKNKDIVDVSRLYRIFLIIISRQILKSWKYFDLSIFLPGFIKI